MNKFLTQLYPHILLQFISFLAYYFFKKTSYHVGPNFLPGGRIFLIIWPESFEKSWQHWLCRLALDFETREVLVSAVFIP
jgi:hypothetical protein